VINIEFFIERPVATIAFTIAIAALGIGALVGMKTDAEPGFALPTVSVTVKVAGAPAADVERDVLAPIESRLAAVGGIARVESVARDGVGRVVVRFAGGTDVDSAEDRLRDAIASARADLTVGIGEPDIAAFDPDAEPALVLAAWSPMDAARLTGIIESGIVPTLRANPGVARIAIVSDSTPLAMRISKAPGFSATAVSNAIRAKLAALEPTLPPGVRIDVVHDIGQHAEASLARLDLVLAISAVLVALVVLACLRSLRSDAIVTATAVTSALAALGALRLFGRSLDVAVVLSLALGIGVVADDAVVVRESIVRHRELGMSRLDAARSALNEITPSMSSATIAIVALLVAVARSGGIASDWLTSLALPFAIVAALSLALSLALVPTLSAFVPDGSVRGRRESLRRQLDRFDGWFEALTDRYHDKLAWSLGHRRWMLTAAGAVVALVVVLHVELSPLRLDPGSDDTRTLVADVRGPDAQTLYGLAFHVADEVRGARGVADVRLSTPPRSQLSVRADASLLSDGPHADERSGLEVGGPAQIEHIDGERSFRVFMRLDSRHAADATSDVQASIRALALPPGYRVMLHGSTTSDADAAGRLAIAALIAGGVLTLVLVAQFGSVTEALAILLTLPVSATGALAAVTLAGRRLDLVSALALLFAMAIVVKQSLLLLSYAHARAQAGVPIRVALVEAGRVRLRAILTTGVALAMAAIPLAVGTGDVSHRWTTLGLAMLGGVAAGVVATLFVLPTAYAALTDAWEEVRARVI
jgi:multidrug efflux pump subunit AcrB